MTVSAGPFDAWRFCMAPMMACTDRHFRYLARLLSRHTRLYTEMVVAAAITRGDASRFLAHDAREAPVALQLGGSDPAALAAAARLGEAAGYCEINLNVGCPSERVQAGRFGACLMAEPTLVADCVAAMRESVRIPVTVKTRLGVDDLDSYEDLTRLVEDVAAAGCPVVILHARKALLNFPPRENRDIPPLDYPRVVRVKRDFPALGIVLNGGLKSIDAAVAMLSDVDGVMVGRAAYDAPALLGEVDARVFGVPPAPLSLAALLERYRMYAERELAAGVPLRTLCRPLLGLAQGRPGARRWRAALSGSLPATGAAALFEAALAALMWAERAAALRAPRGALAGADTTA